jgi:hypothetical protein
MSKAGPEFLYCLLGALGIEHASLAKSMVAGENYVFDWTGARTLAPQRR